MKNKIASIALTVIMILGCMITNIDFNVNTVCADPYNIEISVETKEISIEEIPENRRIQVEVYASNVPNEDFYILDIAYKLDPKLDNWIDRCLGMNAISSLSVSARTENNCLFCESDTIFHSNKKIESGRIYDISVFIPPEVNEGDFYEITPISDCNNGYDYTSFAFESNIEELYDSSNFTYISGGIKIRSSQLESQISTNPVPPSDNINSNSQSENQNIQITNNNEETITLTPSETSLSTVSSVSSTKSTTKMTIVTSTQQTESATNIDTNTEPINTSETIEEKNNNTYNIKLILVLIIFILITVIILTIIIRKRKKK